LPENGKHDLLGQKRPKKSREKIKLEIGSIKKTLLAKTAKKKPQLAEKFKKPFKEDSKNPLNFLGKKRIFKNLSKHYIIKNVKIIGHWSYDQIFIKATTREHLKYRCSKTTKLSTRTRTTIHILYQYIYIVLGTINIRHINQMCQNTTYLKIQKC
jgi:hypothetical protein